MSYSIKSCSLFPYSLKSCGYSHSAAAQGAQSRRQVDRRLERAVHVERYRGVLVRDFPGAADLAKAQRQANPHVGFAAVRALTMDAIETVGEGDVAAGLDLQVAQLAADRSAERCEPAFEVVANGLAPAMLQRGREVEVAHIVRVVGDRRVGVARMHRFGPGVDHALEFVGVAGFGLAGRDIGHPGSPGLEAPPLPNRSGIAFAPRPDVSRNSVRGGRALRSIRVRVRRARPDRKTARASASAPSPRRPVAARPTPAIRAPASSATPR